MFGTRQNFFGFQREGKFRIRFETQNSHYIYNIYMNIYLYVIINIYIYRFFLCIKGKLSERSYSIEFERIQF